MHRARDCDPYDCESGFGFAFALSWNLFNNDSGLHKGAAGSRDYSGRANCASRDDDTTIEVLGTKRLCAKSCKCAHSLRSPVQFPPRLSLSLQDKSCGEETVGVIFLENM